jgi:hypothetical protein
MLITLSAATKTMHVTKRTARKWLGEPKEIQSIKGKTNFLYEQDYVCDTQARMEKAHNEKKERCPGLRQCRSCNQRCKPEEMTNGKCKDCRAFDLCRSFCCPDLLSKHVNQERVGAFTTALKKVLEKFSGD